MVQVQNQVQVLDTSLAKLCNDCNLVNTILLDHVNPNLLNISTITSFFKTNCSIPVHILENISKTPFPNLTIRQRPKKFKNCIIFESSSPKAVVKLFSNGGMHCTGTKNMSSAKEVCARICAAMNPFVNSLRLEDAAIQMINTNTNIGQPIDLEKAFGLFKLEKNCTVSLNRENHSALNIKIKTETMSKPVTALIFTSGSIILIGGNQINDVQGAYIETLLLIDKHIHHIKYAGVYKSKKKVPGEPPKKRGRKRKCDSAEFYDGLML